MKDKNESQSPDIVSHKDQQRNPALYTARSGRSCRYAFLLDLKSQRHTTDDLKDKSAHQPKADQNNNPSVFDLRQKTSFELIDQSELDFLKQFEQPYFETD